MTFNLRISDELNEKLVDLAAKTKRSRNTTIEIILENYFENEQSRNNSQTSENSVSLPQIKQAA